MMKYLPIVPLLALSISLQAQTARTSGAADAAGNASANVSRAATQANAQGNAAAQANAASTHAGQAAASAAEATSVSAELTKKLDTKNAKVGDEVLARTTKTATLADGTKLPRGTKLIGKVTEVQARSRAEKTSHIAFALDHAVMRDGREVPVHAVLTSVTGASALAGSNDDLSASSPMGGVAGGGNAQGVVRAPGGGGLLGGVGSPVGGVMGGAANTVGEAGGAVRSGAGSVMNETQAAGGAVANVGASGSLDHVPVANLPGVMLSSSAETASSGSLDAKGRNIDLESGTRMTLNVSASQQ